VSNELKLSIYSPERRLLKSMSVSEVTVPTTEGLIQILPEHVAMIGVLTTGPISYQKTDGKSSYAAISSGFFEVAENQVSVIAETLEFSSDIDVSRAKIAQQKAEQTLKEAALDEHGFKKYQLKLQRSLIRQQIASK